MNLALHTSHRLSIHTPVFWQGDHHDYQSFRLLLLHTTKVVAAIWYHNDFLTHYMDIANDLTLSALSLSSLLPFFFDHFSCVNADGMEFVSLWVHHDHENYIY